MQSLRTSRAATILSIMHLVSWKKSFGLITDYNFLKVGRNIREQGFWTTLKILFCYSRWMARLYGKMIKKQKRRNGTSFLCFAFKMMARKDASLKNAVRDFRDRFAREIASMAEKNKTATLVSCFGKRNDSLLVWAHYADKRKGMCVEFERLGKDFYDVVYQTLCEPVDFLKIAPCFLGYAFADENQVGLFRL